MKLNVLIAGIIIVTGIIFYTQLSFYEVALILMAVSAIVIAFIPDKYIFPFVVFVVLGFGVFLTGYAFMFEHAENEQMSLMYIHLLMTSFFLLYWVVINHLKIVQKNNKILTDRVKALEKYHAELKVLTTHEFIDQSKKIYKAAMRREEELWLLKIHMLGRGKRIEKSFQETLTSVALDSIRQEFDLITVNENVIIILLQNTTANGVEVVKKRIYDKSTSVFNTIKAPFIFEEIQIYELAHLMKEVEK